MDAIWNFIVSLFGYIMEFCYSISFGNYALALLFYALVFKLVLLPFGIKQQRSQVRMAKLRPKIAVIERKYKGKTDRDSMQQKQMEIMELQKKEGVSPFSGCLQLLIQMPIILALFQIIREPLTYISHLDPGTVIPQLAEIFGVDMAAPYHQLFILNAFHQTGNTIAANLVGNASMPVLTVFGINFGETPSFTAPTFALIVPFLVFAAQFVSMFFMQKLNKNANVQAGSEARVSNMIMMLSMPLMTLFFSFQFPAAIGIYWIYQSLLGLLQSFVLSRLMPLPTFTEEEIRAIEKAEKERQREAIRAAKANKTTSLLHAIDDDDNEGDDVVLPPIRSRYGEDDGLDEPTPPAPVEKKTTALSGMASNVAKGSVKKSNKSKKHKKKK